MINVNEKSGVSRAYIPNIFTYFGRKFQRGLAL